MSKRKSTLLRFVDHSSRAVLTKSALAGLFEKRGLIDEITSLSNNALEDSIRNRATENHSDDTYPFLLL